MIAMIDMGLGNLRSVYNAFIMAGATLELVDSPPQLESTSAVILPGVGAFADGMRGLREKGLIEPLRDLILNRKLPILGICLGMQLLADESEEYGNHKGLGIVPGSVRRILPSPGMRIPNMGWCDVQSGSAESILFKNYGIPQSFYFAHSYHLECEENSCITATVDFDSPLCAAIEKGNIFGVQFHPEKSQDPGLSVLRAFVRHVKSLQCIEEPL